MNSSSVYLIVADFVLFSHLLFVAFVVFGLILVLIGSALDWSWVRNRIFRMLHLLAIGVVAVQSWFGIICPLTTLENWLRRQAGDVAYGGTFVSHWMQTLLYYQAPDWVFVAGYSAFGALVAASWYFVRPNSLVDRNRTDAA